MAAHRRSADSGGRFARLDMLRGCAALMVIGFHANTLLSDPALDSRDLLHALRFNLDTGVELFFVLSGYLIALPFVRSLMNGGSRPDLRAYALRRAARILPGYWLVLGLAMVLAGGSGPTGLAVIPHVLLLHGLIPGETYRPVDVAWTLSVEAVFYLLLPMVVIALAAGGRIRSPRSLVIATCAIWLGSAGLALLTAATMTPGNVALVVMRGAPGMLCQFCPGILIAILQVATERQGVTMAAHLRRRGREIVGAGLLVWASCLLFNSSGADAGYVVRNQIAGAAFGLVVLGTLAFDTKEGRWVRRLAPLGTVSYGLYLWHWLIAHVLASTQHGVDSSHSIALGWLLAWLVLLATTLPFAVLSWRFVESPAQRWAARRGGRATAIARNKPGMWIDTGRAVVRELSPPTL